MRDYSRHAHSVRAASSVRADMIFGKDRASYRVAGVPILNGTEAAVDFAGA